MPKKRDDGEAREKESKFCYTYNLFKSSNFKSSILYDIFIQRNDKFNALNILLVHQDINLELPPWYSEDSEVWEDSSSNWHQEYFFGTLK